MKLNIQIHLEELQCRIASHLRHCFENNERDRIIKLCGISGTGKTQLALSYTQNTKCNIYFSFRGLDNRTALTQFKNTFSVWCDLSSATTWQEAFQLLVPFFKKHTTRIILDDLEHSKSESDVITAIENLSESLIDMKNLFFIAMSVRVVIRETQFIQSSAVHFIGHKKTHSKNERSGCCKVMCCYRRSACFAEEL